MKQEDQIKLFSNVAEIKAKVDVIYNEVHPEVKKNTKFRLYITGFILIAAPLAGFAMKVIN